MGGQRVDLIQAGIAPAQLSMPADQAVDLLVGRGGATYAVPATYIGDFPPEGESASVRANEFERVQLATQAFAAAIGGEAPPERELRRVVELLHEAWRAVEGEPRYRLADGRVVIGSGITARARMIDPSP